MPFPNEHACRLRDPGDFKPNSFRRMSRNHDGKKYDVIMGKLKGEDSMTDQAFRYKKDTWKASEARSHCSSHDGSFEAASDSQADYEDSRISVSKQFKAVDIELKAIAGDDSSGTVEAIVSVFGNVDSAREVVMPGAFKNSLAQKMPRVAWGHSWTDIIGKVVDAQELLAGDLQLPDSIKSRGGLYVKAQLNLNIQRGKEAWELLKAGDVSEWSIGYRVIRAHRVTEEGTEEDDTFGFNFGRGIRYLDELQLYEVSPVLAGANELTTTLGVKSEMSLGDQIETSVAAFNLIWEEAKALLERRQKEGRTFSAANVAKLKGFATSLEEMAVSINSMLEVSKSESEANSEIPEAKFDPSASIAAILASQTALKSRILLNI